MFSIIIKLYSNIKYNLNKKLLFYFLGHLNDIFLYMLQVFINTEYNVSFEEIKSVENITCFSSLLFEKKNTQIKTYNNHVILREKYVDII